MKLFLLFLGFGICLSGYQKVNAQHPAAKRNAQLPIQQARTISFHTDEASYLDVDISPDGNKILFSFLGNLYLMPSGGGAARQLSSGLALNRAPVFSPDGKWIAYESDATGSDGLHVMDTAGNFHVVLDEGSDLRDLRPVWLPDSKFIVAGKAIYHLDGTKTLLPEDLHYLGFSDSGQYAYCLETRPPSDSSFIIRIERNSGERTGLIGLQKPAEVFKNAKISRDARYLAYIKKSTSTSIDSLAIIELASGDEKILANFNAEFSRAGAGAVYSFSPDSRFLFFGFGGKIHRFETATGTDRIIPFSADVRVDLGELNYNKFAVSLDSFPVRYVRSAQRSSDGKQLIFSALNRIYAMDLPKGQPKVLASQPVNQFQPVYSPDGQWIAYVSWDDGAGGHVWRVSTRGGKPEQLTKVSGFYQHPSWSPDGSKIVVAKGNKLAGRFNPGIGKIEVISIKDKAVKVIVDSVPLFNHPSFSSDGLNVMYSPNQVGANQKIWPKMVQQHVITKEQKVLAIGREDVPGRKYSIPFRQISISPDKKYIVFLHSDNLFLAPLFTLAPGLILDESSPIRLIRFGRGGIDPAWEEGGKILSWVRSNQYYRIDPEKILRAASGLPFNKTLPGLPQTKIVDVEIQPDQEIQIRLEPARAYGKGIIALTNGRIITMHNGKVIENGTALIKDGRILQVGETGSVSIPKGAKVINLQGKVIMPGFIDVHAHMRESMPPDVFLQQSWERLINLSCGITTVREPLGNFDTFGYAELVETGQILGPRHFTVGQPAVKDYFFANSLDIKIFVDNNKMMGGTVVKEYLQPTRLQRQLLLSACDQAGLNMINEGYKHPYYALGMIKDGSQGIEHSPNWGDVFNDLVTFYAKSGTYLTPAFQLGLGNRQAACHYFRKYYGQAFLNENSRFIPESIKMRLTKQISEGIPDSSFIDLSKVYTRIKRAGGKVMMGSHGENQGIGAHWELWALQLGGMTNMEALETATITAAEGLGMQKDLGSIEAGKIADLIILDKNPLDDIHNTASTRYVMKSGVLYESKTLNEIWPKKKKGPTVWK